MSGLITQLKALRLHGMVSGYAELLENGGEATISSSQWLLEHLLKAETTDRAMRSVRYQMQAARFPIHRDLAGFDFEQSKVDRRQIMGFASTEFTEKAENLVLIGGTGTGKTHLATALGVEAVVRHGKRVRFYSTVELVNTLEQEQAAGRAGRLAHQLVHLDLVIYTFSEPVNFIDKEGLWSLSISGYAGIGGGLNIAYAGGTLEITSKFGTGIGGGLVYDPAGRPSPHSKNCGNGYIVRTSFQASASVGSGGTRIGGAYTAASGNALTTPVGGGYQTITGPRVSAAPGPIGFSWGVNLSAEFGSYSNW